MSHEPLQSDEHVTVEEQDLDSSEDQATGPRAESQAASNTSGQPAGGADAASPTPFYDFDSTSEHGQQHAEKHNDRPRSAFSDDSSDEEGDGGNGALDQDNEADAQVATQYNLQEQPGYIWQRTGLAAPPDRAFDIQTFDEYDDIERKIVQTAKLYPYGSPRPWGRSSPYWGSANEQYYRRDFWASNGRFGRVPLFDKGTRPHATKEKSKLVRIRSIDDVSSEASSRKRVRLSLIDEGEEDVPLRDDESRPVSPSQVSADDRSSHSEPSEAGDDDPADVTDDNASSGSEDEVITDAHKVRPLVQTPSAPSDSANRGARNTASGSLSNTGAPRWPSAQVTTSPSLYVPKSGTDWSEEDDDDFDISSIPRHTPPSNASLSNAEVGVDNTTDLSSPNDLPERPQSRCGDRDDEDEAAKGAKVISESSGNVGDDIEEDNEDETTADTTTDAEGPGSPAKSVDSVTGLTQEEGLRKADEFEKSSFLERARQTLYRKFPDHFEKLGEVYPEASHENYIDRLESKVHLSRQMMERLRAELAKMAEDRWIVRGQVSEMSEELARKQEYIGHLEQCLDERYLECDRREQELHSKMAMLSQDGAAEAYYDQTQELAEKLVATEDKLQAAYQKLSNMDIDCDQAGPGSASTQPSHRLSQTSDQSTPTDQGMRSMVSSGQPLLPRHVVRWPAHIRSSVAESIAKFVTRAHRYETRQPMELSTSAVEELMGPKGETPFEKLVSALNNRGYVFRPDHLASETETFMREQGHRNLEVMLATRKLSSTAPEDCRRLLEEIDDLHQRATPDRRSIMSEEEERRYENVVAELGSCHVILAESQQETDLLKQRLEQQATNADQSTNESTIVSLNHELDRSQAANAATVERIEELEQENLRLECFEAELGDRNVHVNELEQANCQLQEDLATTRAQLAQCRERGEKLAQDVKHLREQLQSRTQQLKQHRECAQRVEALEAERARHLEWLQRGYHKIEDVKARKDELATRMLEHCAECKHWRHHEGHHSSFARSESPTAEPPPPQGRSGVGTAAYRSRLSGEQAQRLARLRQSESYRKAWQTAVQRRNRQAMKAEEEEKLVRLRLKMYGNVFGWTEIPYMPREERLRQLQEAVA